MQLSQAPVQKPCKKYQGKKENKKFPEGVKQLKITSKKSQYLPLKNPMAHNLRYFSRGKKKDNMYDINVHTYIHIYIYIYL